ncbi:MAG: NYN domain-containing protein [Proteobacteria bacterium]|nr:NYN domain-containing protein [Pseudomonadota bacterium]
MKKTIVYVDGYNLYYFLRQHHPKLKWLDLVGLAENMLAPDHAIVSVNFYTAPVIGDKKAMRQKTYWVALKKHASANRQKLKIYIGEFKRVIKKGKLTANNAVPLPVLPSSSFEFETLEEKQTDVTLAIQLVRDAFLKRFDVAAVITNDTDFISAIRMVRQEAKLPVWLLSPTPKDTGRLGPHKGLRRLVTPDFVKRIEEKHLKSAQLPKRIPKTNIVRPKGWG